MKVMSLFEAEGEKGEAESRSAGGEDELAETETSPNVADNYPARLGEKGRPRISERGKGGS